MDFTGPKPAKAQGRNESRCSLSYGSKLARKHFVFLEIGNTTLRESSATSTEIRNMHGWQSLSTLPCFALARHTCSRFLSTPREDDENSLAELPD